jgi:hypothetical protein
MSDMERDGKPKAKSNRLMRKRVAEIGVPVRLDLAAPAIWESGRADSLRQG